MSNPNGYSGRKPRPHRKRALYLADPCTCGHLRHEHALGPPPYHPPNFGRQHCHACECPLFVHAQREMRQKRGPQKRREVAP